MAGSSYILSPISTGKRVATIDILRGVAVLGMLAMTIQSFAMPMSAYLNPSTYERLSGNDLYVWLVSHVFADQKFLGIFSLLFGASIIMLSQKAQKEHLRSTDLQYKRFVYLGLLGLIHAYLVWYGDVLFMYAVCGLLMFIFRNKRTAVQLRAGIIFLAIGSAISLLLGYSVALWEPGEYEVRRAQIWDQPAQVMADEIEGYHSNWERQILTRAPQAFRLQTSEFLLRYFWKISGMILIGMALYKRRVFKGKHSKKYYLKMIIYGMGIGLPLVAGGVFIDFLFNWDYRISYFFTSQLNYWGSVLMSLGYVGIIVLFCKASTRSFLAKRLADVGRMSLSNYLLQSILCGFIFYGHGFNLFGDLDRSAQAVFVLAIWVVNIVFSSIWLKYFQFGPFEWVWRSLTYGKVQPLAKGFS
ncbi:DUF418 domain-containing protein [Roseivirga pacifica]|uniref:DUF418 domain-containing protein n=1 Tax=Roseivirga pacifica TaxID=1267423 RepID=UPI0020952DA7|nr:DUF418 domain-containing protein [Roseivirga pacifica]MCO6359287.1 DUF418 domain-containing protein [Roseivirga pacifica]MCO6366656.1 DUF418 domain-containing protein [Roseivirga pacifica]MCO6370811.1 DUF418 domain-containing protein [Roseivirga pacifica]MCO6374296.1 DUF418 domain-containing protein [Roseivirga pacifica]MCO6379571.1 DUF418 domain-containing protein [Roseivirga pacifica]